MNELIKVINLEKSFYDVLLFKKVNMTILNKGMYGLKGESGSGKSSLLYILSLLDDNYKGNILYQGTSIKEIQNKDKFIANHIGFLFQNPVFFFNMTVEENLSLITSKENKEEINYYLLEVGLKNKKYELVKNLSGGERMRLSLVRALANNPDILFCDEPTGSLSYELGIKIMDLLKKESQRRTVFIVSHDINLLNEYVDYLYELKNQNITLVKENKITDVFAKKEKLESDNKIFFSFILRYIKNSLKSKRLQTFICFLALILCFFTIGFSSLLKNEVSSSIKDSFSSLMEKDQMLLKSNKETSEKAEIISASLNEAEDLISSSAYFYETNYLYSGNFENQFMDANYLAMIGESTIPFYDVGLRSVSEAIYLDDIPLSTKMYPYRITSLDLNEGVLGLRKSDVRKICKGLNLENLDIETLSEYLTYHSIDFCFYFENESWGYKNEILFRLKAFFINDEKIIIAHSNKNYIQDFMEEKMKLPISLELNVNDYLPWTIKRATYIRVRKEDEYNALKEYFSSAYYENYDLTKVEGNLNSTFLSSSYHEGKYILTYAYSGKIPYDDVLKLSKNNTIYNVFPVSSYYPVVEELLVSGFNNSLFITSKENDLDLIIDYYSSLSENVDTLDLSNVNLSETISEGNLITAAMKKGLKLETKKPKLTLGQYPENENEIVISSTLAKKLFSSIEGCLNERVYLSFHSYDSTFLNQFENSSLIVSGVYDSKEERIYQEELWYPIYIVLNYNYPLESIYINTFLIQSEIDIDQLNNTFLDYTFLNPLKEIYASVDEVILMIEILLLVFMILLLVSSLGILFITIEKIMTNAEKEIGLLICVGKKKSSILTMYFTYGISYSFIALIISSLMLMIVNIIIRTVYFNLPFSLNFSVNSFILMGVVFLILTLPLCFLKIILPLKKKSLNLLKRYY